MSPFLNVKETAAWTRLSQSEVYRLIHEGKIEARRHGRRNIMVVRESLESWSLNATVKPKNMTRFEEARLKLRGLKAG